MSIDAKDHLISSFASKLEQFNMVRVLIPVAALFLCWITVFGSAGVLPSYSRAELSYPSFVFYVDSYDQYTYGLAISQLRNELARNGSVVEGVPELPVHVDFFSEWRFVLLTLSKEGRHAILALDVTSASIVGFKAGTKSYFFRNFYGRFFLHPLFSDTSKHRLPFDATYESLKDNGAIRWNTELGTYPLNNATEQIYDYASDDSMNIAPSLLVIIQMITEASRFKYIEEKLKDSFKEGLVPKCDILSLENNWESLSTAIQGSKNGILKKPVILLHESCIPYIVTRVGEVIPKMGLLHAPGLIPKLSSVV